ncbi:hypothetical protein [Paenibacillus elgii]|uniref:hypothetical protein n=1 Tax=Paenibacillus elgii TaxID=189691 RepID=UPI00203ABC1B|nr:hypothetical protein [Paenibacillus elgii]MCM3273677.1 hypothetical protein [Paenibacillus elgii]
MSVVYSEELFPEASKVDIARTKTYLKKFVKMKKALEDFEQNPPETEKQRNEQAKWKRIVRNIERAKEQILQYDVSVVIEYRFIKGNSRAATILRFSSWGCCDKTIDRKIEEGTISIANTLKYLE